MRKTAISDWTLAQVLNNLAQNSMKNNGYASGADIYNPNTVGHPKWEHLNLPKFQADKANGMHYTRTENPNILYDLKAKRYVLRTPQIDVSLKNVQPNMPKLTVTPQQVGVPSSAASAAPVTSNKADLNKLISVLKGRAQQMQSAAPVNTSGYKFGSGITIPGVQQTYAGTPIRVPFSGTPATTANRGKNNKGKAGLLTLLLSGGVYGTYKYLSSPSTQQLKKQEEERKKLEQQATTNSYIGAGIGGAGGGTLGFLIGSQLSDSPLNRLLWTLAGTAGGAGIGYITGKEWNKPNKEQKA